MGEAVMFGWSATEALKLLSLCNDFRKAYSNGGEGASRHLADLNSKVERFQAILERLKTEVTKHDSKVYIDYAEIDSTLKACSTFFTKNPIYLKSPDERTFSEKLWLTVKYVASAEKEVEKLCKLVESHYHSIDTYLALLNTKYNKIQIEQNDNILQRVDQIDTNVRLILGRLHQRSGSVTEIPHSMNSIHSSLSGGTDLSGSRELADLITHYEILKDLRSNTLDGDDTEAMDNMIKELGDLKRRVENLVEREGTRNAQERIRQLRIGPSFDILDGVMTGDNFRQEKLMESKDSAISFVSDDTAAPSIKNFGAVHNTAVSNSGTGTAITTQQSLSGEEIRNVEIEISVSNNHRESFPCTLHAKFLDQCITEITPDPKKFESIQLPKVLEYQPRPVPHVEWRGKSALETRWQVYFKGTNAAITPSCVPTYIFRTEDDSKKFQELVVGKTLLHSINVSKIKSNDKSKKGSESEQSRLRLWRDPSNNNDKSVGSHSLMYCSNTATRANQRQPVEFYLSDFDWPPEKIKPRAKSLALNFKSGVRTEMRFLRFEFNDGLDDPAKQLASYLQTLK